MKNVHIEVNSGVEFFQSFDFDTHLSSALAFLSSDAKLDSVVSVDKFEPFRPLSSALNEFL